MLSLLYGGDHCCDIDEVRWRSPFPLEIEVDDPDCTEGQILQFSCFLVPVFQAGEQDISLCRRYLGIYAIFEIFGKYAIFEIFGNKTNRSKANSVISNRVQCFP